MAMNLSEQMKLAKTEPDVKKTFGDYFALPNVRLDNYEIDLMSDGIYLESKRFDANIYAMLAQLLLTIHKHADKIDLPDYIGGFDNKKCALIEFDDLYQRMETYSDINWNQTPSSVDAKTIALVEQFVKELGAADSKKALKTYNYDTDEKQLKSALSNPNRRTQITSSNFVAVYQKWLRELDGNIVSDKHKKIETENAFLQKQGIILGDFYLADLMGDDTESALELHGLNIIRKNDVYTVSAKTTELGLVYKHFFIKDMNRHMSFWGKYKRPPKREYWNIILERRPLLTPQKVREEKGAYFTPDKWVEKSQEYMTRAFGDDYANMYIWDCAAGTGNLLVGLPQERRNIFASTLDAPEVDIMRQNDGLGLFHNQVFQFDFLNDEFKPVSAGGKLPDRLYDIIKDPEERKKLIIYINPPYAEASNNKKGVATQHKTYSYFHKALGKSVNELFVQFMARIYTEMPDSILALFSTLKIVSAPNFKKFRDFFKAEFKCGFIVRANTFHNVKGHFPIGFTIWDLANKMPITSIRCDVIENNGDVSGVKNYFAPVKLINDWIKLFDTANNDLGGLNCKCTDFQQQKWVLINRYGSLPSGFQPHIKIDESNLIEASIYLAVRQAIDASWLNDRDQFLFPLSKTSDGAENLLESRQEFLYESDDNFKNDCLIFTIFHGQNKISSNDGVNYWLPFTEQQAGSQSTFASNFMSKFLASRNIPNVLSPAARSVYDAGLAMWQYYHARGANPNVSLYDIKEFFKERNDKGRMNSKSSDAEFNKLESGLASALKTLAAEIEPKIYEYGFLRK